MIPLNKRALFTADESRQLDTLTGVESFSLMKKAGQAVYEKMMSLWPDLSGGGHLHIFCGAGNNAGDGYVVATLAIKAGLHVHVTALKPPDQLTGDALLAWRDFEQYGGRVTPRDANTPITGEVIIDALLGTGITGQVSAPYHLAIEAINQADKPTLSVDIPSGLNSDTGAEAGIAVQADVTVTIISLKKGLFTADGAQACGQLYFADLDTPETTYNKISHAAELLCRDTLFPLMKPRHKNSHKGDFGSLLLIGGDAGMGGALIMAGEAALCSGVGRVTAFTREVNVSAFLARCPEIMVHASENIELDELLLNKTAIVVGPGLGLTEWGKSILQTLKSKRETLKNNKVPILFDADALNLMADADIKDDCPLTTSPYNVFTPHPGEAARLLKTNTGNIQQDRFTALKKLQQRLNGCIVLKGAGSLISSLNSHTYVCREGNPGMAIAGSGDILSGLIGGLLAQKQYDPVDAARIGVWIHASAGGRIVAQNRGQLGIRATDLISGIRFFLNQLVT